MNGPEPPRPGRPRPPPVPPGLPGGAPAPLGYPRGPWPTDEPPTRRFPRPDPDRCDGCAACARACPNGALRTAPSASGTVVSLDYGLCLFCHLCVDACPSGAMAAGPMGELAVRHRDDLRLVRGGPRPDPERLRHEVGERVGRLFAGSLSIRAVDAGSCNGCEVEIAALQWPRYDLERLGIYFVASPRHADALLVSGPVTRNMRAALERTYRAVPGPSFVIAVGACGISGGPFVGSAEIEGGVDRVLPVEVYIPGCPPSPLGLLYGLWLALGRAEPRLRQGELPAPAGSVPGTADRRIPARRPP